ncbi:MAG TPA: LacI family DNA-binding transcriptional regulator [Actinomycetes bacterium]|jgi:LacI family transcriptional regulator|nr:LacI family DNA-binding transcriptional regulator [Actinomycetes bacterium]
MSRPRKRVTIQQVAEAVGLSAAAVSYALRGSHVSKETEERVRRVATELGYEAHPIARALASGRTSMVGVISGSLEDLWQQQVSVGIGRELLARDLYALIVDAGGDPEREQALALQLRDQSVDGLILSPLDPSAPLWADLAETLPVVAIGDSLQGARPTGEVLFDNRAGVTLALEHLHQLGHRRIAVLTSTQPSTPDRPADTYVLAEARRLGLDVAVRTAPHSLAEATKVARKVLSANSRPTALFCFSDSIAYGGYAAARDLSLRIPADLSITGYDNHPVSCLLSPPLTTFDWDREGIIRTAVQLVVAAINGRPRRRRVVKTPVLHLRGSTGAPPRPGPRRRS